MIGIGLGNEKDISVNGLEAVKKCNLVYLEGYTSKLSCSVDELSKFYGKEVIVADREMVEKKADEILVEDKDVAFLVIGDVFSATTHTDLKLRALEKGIKVKVIHNASILSAIGVVGLELYKFGKITSIPFENENVRSPVDVFENNDKNKMHTLFLLDLRPDEERFMTINQAIEYLVEYINDNTKAVACAAIGTDKEQIKYGKLKDLIDIKFESFPQCLIIPSKLHFIEEEALELFE